jgi:hypothetical protein
MNKMRVFSDLLPIPSYAVIILCFFLPFLTIKCGNTELASVSGFDMIRGVDMKESMKNGDISNMLGDKFKDTLATQDEEESESISDEKNELAPPIILIIPFLMAINGLILCFFKFRIKALVQVILSTVGFVCLVTFGIILFSSQEIKALKTMDGGELGGFGSGIISVSLGIAYYIATFLFLTMPILIGLKRYFENLKKERLLETPIYNNSAFEVTENDNDASIQ